MFKPFGEEAGKPAKEPVGPLFCMGDEEEGAEGYREKRERRHGDDSQPFIAEADEGAGDEE